MNRREVESEGRSAEEAIERALVRLDLPRDRVEWEQLEAGRPGFLGLGSRPFRVRVWEKLPEATEVAASLLTEVIRLAGFTLQRVEWAPAGDEEHVLLKAYAEGADGLAGRHRDGLDALQVLLNAMVQRAVKDGTCQALGQRIVLDLNGARARRDEAVRAQARSLAEQVRATGQAAVLKTMNAHERKVVHLLFQNDPELSTHSEGEEPNRHVVIAPRSE